MSFFDERQRMSPEVYARAVHQKLKINEFPINVQDIICNLGIFYKETNFEDMGEVDGILSRKGNKSLIVINNSISYPGRKNFTIAHELGHHEIKGHDLQEYRCNSKDLELYQAEQTYEFEANRFATEFLMPEEKIQGILKRKRFEYETIATISSQFGTSLTSAAIQVVSLTLDPCGIVVSSNNQILWSRKSKSFRYEFQPKGKKLSPNTYAADYFLNKEIPDHPEPVIGLEWLGSSGISKDLTLYEHAVCFPNIGLVLSLISLPEKPDYEEESEVDE